MELAGKVALITGGSGGIGEALATVLVDAGARVVLFSRRESELIRVVESLGPEHAAAVAGDVTQMEDLRLAVLAAVRRFGGLDILVNNAGIGLRGRVESLRPELMERAWRTNVLGLVMATQAALPTLRKSEQSLIVNISSGLSIRPAVGLAGYASTKAAVNQLTDSLRAELHGNRTRVLLVFPGSIRNEFGRNAIDSTNGQPLQFGVPSGQPERTSLDAARDILSAIRNDLDDWRYDAPASEDGHER